jgi:hypothetical protein
MEQFHCQFCHQAHLERLAVRQSSKAGRGRRLGLSSLILITTRCDQRVGDHPKMGGERLGVPLSGTLGGIGGHLKLGRGDRGGAVSSPVSSPGAVGGVGGHLKLGGGDWGGAVSLPVSPLGTLGEIRGHLKLGVGRLLWSSFITSHTRRGWLSYKALRRRSGWSSFITSFVTRGTRRDGR